MHHFCTLFDRNYLFKGLALHASLMQHAKAFCLHILCMDGIAYEVLCKLQLPNVRLIPIDQFEDDELLLAKQGRTAEEYCWTCTPSLPLFILKNNADIDQITYVDADIFLYDDPSPIFEEFGDASIMIVEHRYEERLRHLVINGIYNVEWLTFRRDRNGLACLEWWRDRCNEWCYRRMEDGKKGDQKYLDDWLDRFDGVHVLQHVGAGVAPWNFSQYQVSQKNGRITIDSVPLIFYHFHQFKLFRGDRYYFMAPMYTEVRPVPMMIYGPYIQALNEARRRVKGIDPEFDYGIETGEGYWSLIVRGLAKKMVPHGVKRAIREIMGRAGQS